MSTRNPGSVWAPLWVILAVFVLGGVSLAVMRLESLTNPSNSFGLDVSRQTKVAQSLLQYREVTPIVLPISGAHSFAVGQNGMIAVCGETSVGILDPEGTLLRTLLPIERPRCVAVAGEDHQHSGRVYVGGTKSIEVFSQNGEAIARWELDVKMPMLTAISLTHEHVYVADAGNQIVLRFDHEGNRTGEIDNGFVIPSANFDLVAQENGLVYVVNPGARRVETYTSSGVREAAWGRTGSAMEDFFGCCNPAHLAVLPGGDFVTSEKGIPRIKVYDAVGNLKCVVASTDQLLQRPALPTTSIVDLARAPSAPADLANVNNDIFDIAVDAQGRVLALDPSMNLIRVFTRGTEASERTKKK